MSGVAARDLLGLVLEGFFFRRRDWPGVAQRR